MEMPVEKVIMAVNALDLKVLSLENVELLQRMVPTDQEVLGAYRCLNMQIIIVQPCAVVSVGHPL